MTEELLVEILKDAFTTAFIILLPILVVLLPWIIDTLVTFTEKYFTMFITLVR